MQRGTGEAAVVEGGPFDGAKIFDGIIFNRNQAIIGIRLVNDDGTWADVPSYNVDLAYLPHWHDQGRGIPRIATCLLKWMDLQDIHDFLRRGLKRASSIGLKFKKEEGEAGLGNEVITAEDDTNVAAAGPGTTVVSGAAQPAGTPQIYYEEVEGGEMYYLNSTTGEEIDALEYKSPHPNVEAFIERTERECVASVGWLYELLDLSQTGRAPTRLACDIANHSIWQQQSAAIPRAYRAVCYALAKAMKNGFLSRNEAGNDPYKWEFGLPKEVSVDAGNDEAADRENSKLGTTSKTILAQKRGWHRRDILRQRQTEIVENAVTAAAIEKETAGKVTFDKAMDLLEQRNPNGITPPDPPEPREPDGDEK